ncbi:hypothetical protein FJZ18_01595 [Candidatus Pacearchaeota archaeon]|nr:hypothetical protein [Candidatus Pacearchaeota archaeon]
MINKKILLSLMVLGAVLGYLIISQRGLYVDEHDHYRQLMMFFNGQISVYASIPFYPLYHAFIFIFGWIFGNDSISFFRFINLLIGASTALISYFIISHFSQSNAVHKTVRFFYIPIIFPYLFLIYTDIFSLFLVLLSFLLVLKKHYTLAQIFAIISVFARQNNAIWIGFIILWIIMEEKNKIKVFSLNFIRLIAPTIIGAIVILYAFFIQDFFVIKAKNIHPVGFFTGNIFIFLFIAFILFLPLHWINRKVVTKELSKTSTWVFIALAFIIYLVTFNVEHHFNKITLFFRNQALLAITSSLALKILFFIPLAYTMLSLKVTKTVSNISYILYPFILLFLLPMQHIEFRYSIIPISLLFLLVDDEHYGERLNLAFYSILSFLILFLISQEVLYF